MKMTEFYAVNTEISEVNLDGEDVLRVIKGKDKMFDYDENTYAKLKDTIFLDGVIEVDMKSRLLPDAPDFARGFIGLAFHISDADDAFEAFYIRPTKIMRHPSRRSWMNGFI